MKYLSVLVLLALILPATALAADDTIKIGVSIPLTGDIASYGDDLKAGIGLAASDINARGGLLGKKLQPIFEDDGADPKLAVAIANRFLGENVNAVIDGMSRTSLAIGPIYAEENIPFMNLASTDAVTAHNWPNIVRVLPKNGQEAPKAAKLIMQRAAGKKLAVIYASEEYSSNLAESALSLMASQSVKPDLVRKLSDKDQDFSALITQMKDQKIGAVFLGLWPKEAGLFLRQADAANFHPTYIGDFTASIDDLVKVAGAMTDGLAFTMTPDPQYIPSAQPVIKELATRNIINRPFAVYAYLLIEIYADAAQKAGTTESAKLLQALKSQTFSTILGPVSFAANGDLQGIGFQYYEWKSGKIVPLADGPKN